MLQFGLSPGPQPSGIYTFECQQSAANYVLDLHVTAVPEPTSVTLGLAGLLVLHFGRRRSRGSPGL